MRNRRDERATPPGVYKREYGTVPDGMTKEWWLECMYRIIKATEPHDPKRASELRPEPAIVEAKR